jgi:alpha-tubulin suppressor-like RCC1 family protein
MFDCFSADQEVYATGQNRFYQCGLFEPTFVSLKKLPHVFSTGTQGHVKAAAGWEHSLFYTGML